MSQRLRFNFDEIILPLLRGAEEDDDDENVDTHEEEEDENEEDEDNSGSKNSESISRAEYDKVLERMKLADKRATTAEKKAKSYEDKEKSDQQKLEEAIAEKDTKLSELSTANQKLLLDNAFLTDNTFNWHNPKTAMKLLDRDSVTVTDDGTVEGMAEALKKLADENSYLLKSTSGNDDSTSGDGPSGDGGNKRRKQKGPDPKALARKYPALQGRV